jgi:N-acetylglucosaminyl-diphospho-decaprenol L-rhamnosyltransferase
MALRRQALPDSPVLAKINLRNDDESSMLRETNIAVTEQSANEEELVGLAQSRDKPMAQLTGKSYLAIVVVSYNSALVLPGLLDSLSAGLEGIEKYEIIVADNESADDSVAIALAHAIRPKVIRMGRNAGYAAGINAAAATVDKGAHLLILNPDVRLLPGAARMLVARLADSSVGVAVPKIFAEDGTIAWSLRREPSILTAWTDAIFGGTLAARIGMGEKISDSALYDKDGLTEWAEGSVLAVAARTRGIVGDWDESLFLYSEETDYMRRVRECGLSVAYVPQAQAIHIGGDYENPRLAALLAVNRIRYYRRYHGLLSTAMFRMSIIVGEGSRAFRGPGHRAAFQAALTTWRLPPEKR